MPSLQLPIFHPDTVLADFEGKPLTINDATTGVVAFGATGSGKTSGPAKALAKHYLRLGFSGIVFCSKREERPQWEQWAKEAGRLDNLRIVKPGADLVFNFLEWERSRGGAGAGHAINLVAMLDEIASAVAGKASEEGSQGDNKFFEDALHHMNTNAVDLALLSGLPISLQLLRDIIVTAPQSAAEANSEKWKQASVCSALLQTAEKRTNERKNEEELADFEEVRNYWTIEFPTLSEKTRSIITLSFSMVARPFLTRPLRKLFSGTSTITPEECFKEGYIVIVDLPVQEFGLVGRCAALAWKYCWQKAILRRKRPTPKPDEPPRYLRPVFTWADEAQVFITRGDAAFQAVARSAAGCTVYLTQNLEALRSILGSSDAVQALLGNLQIKFYCQNTGETNEWASKYVFGEWWTESETLGRQSSASSDGRTARSISSSLVRKFILEPSVFTTLKRGGERAGFEVQAILYKGGEQFLNPDPRTRAEHATVPYALVTFHQKAP